jgi:hypothetical protein
MFSTNLSLSQVVVMTPGGSSTACSGNFYDSGNIGGNYVDNENATHTICPSTPGAMLQVAFTSFNIETCCDAMAIYNGPSTASPLIGTYTSSPGTVTSTHPTGCLTFVFTSDLSVVYSGWEATISCISTGPIVMTPGGSSSACSGNFYDSGNVGGNYVNGENATHTITPSTPGAMLQATFTSFNIESGWDNFSVYNGPSTASPLIGTYTGTSGPGTVTSTDPSGALTFVFTSDGSVVYSGWEATLMCISTGPIIMTPGGISSTCSGNFYDSGNLGGTYQNNENATHTITPSTPGAMLQANFTAFDLESGWDYLSVYNGPTTASPLIGTYSGTTGPGTVTSTDPSGALTFVFTSDGSVTYAGWSATLSCNAPPAIVMTPGGSSTTCSGIFYDSGNMGGNYLNNENATHTITPSTPGAMLQAVFTSFSLETCCDDLTIYDGPTTASPVIGVYTTNPGTITSTHSSGALTFVFSSDGSVTATGWAATLSCVTPTGIIMTPGGSSTACSGNFYDSGNSGGNYANSENATHTITPSTPGSMLQVTFNSFSLETCCDNLTVYNGPTTASPLLGTYTTNPGTLTSTHPSGALTFVFTSDGSVTATGWAATLACVAAPGIIMTPGGSSTACSGNFYDSGNLGGNYVDNENATHTISPSTPGAMLQVTFTSFSVETCCDNLTVYNGPTTASPSLGTFTSNPGTLTSTHPSGALTFVFISDGSIVSTGWTATLACITPPPCVQADVPSTITATSTSVCSGGTSTLNWPTYALNDATAWSIYEGSCGGTLLGTSATNTFNVNPTVTTSYFIRGEGGCTTPGVCGTITITVEDVLAPVPNATTLSDVTAECSVTTLTAPTATDNCAGTITATHNATLPITAQGTTIVTWTYNDGNGNTSTQTQNVVIDDVTAPDVPILLTLNGECSVTAVPPTTTDNCAGTITATTTDPLTYNGEGFYIINWTFNDGNGNTSSTTQSVIIDDATAPAADVSTLADVTSGCEVTSLTAPTATDNCGGTVTVTNDATLPITAPGTTLVTWTYDDGNGNTSTQTQNVIITGLDLSVNLIGETIVANSTTSTYQWIDCNNGNAIIVGATNQTFAPTVTGNYAVILTEGGCTDTSSCYLVEVSGLYEHSANIHFTVQPNPSTGIFNLSIDGLISNNANINVYNAIGQIVYSTAVNTGLGEYKMILDLSANEPGVYIVNVLGENGTELMKRIVKL